MPAPRFVKFETRNGYDPPNEARNNALDAALLLHRRGKRIQRQ